MAYTKTNWVNGTTPINETNLNKIEDELQALDKGMYYSNNETQIGYWTDNKPLYRKVLSSNAVSGDNTLISHGISNLKLVTHFEAIANNTTSYGIAYPINNTAFTLEVNRIDDTDIDINIGSGFSSSYWTIYYVIEYTKTSD